jgi:hypothetical protein
MRELASIYFNHYELDMLFRMAHQENLKIVLDKKPISIDDGFYYKWMMKFTEEELKTILYFMDKHLEVECLRDRFQKSGENIFRWCP